jgi:hypothetical protein
MSTEEKPKGIPLSALLEPDGEIDTKIRKLKPGSRGGVVMVLKKRRNLGMLKDEKTASREDPKLLAALGRELTTALEAVEAKWAPDKRKGKISDKRQHIIALVAAHPEIKKADDLRAFANEDILEPMTQKTFANIVSEIRRQK